MLVFLITNQNFEQVKSKTETTAAGITTKIVKGNKKILVTVNSLAPFAIYKWEKDGHFAISNRLNMIAEYIAQFGCELTFTPVSSKYLSKAYVNHARDCDVQKVTRWNKVIINRQGELKIIPPKKQPFSIELTSKRGVRYLLKWLKKYLVIAKRECEKGNFIPTLTGGLDTRTLTWFWRDWYQGNEYYLKAVKPDRHSDADRGKVEVQISGQVLETLEMTLKRTELMNSRVTFSGIFTETSCEKYKLNRQDFIYDFIVFHMNDKREFYNVNFVCPFVDNVYLQLRHPELHFTRVLLALLLCPDLLDISLCTLHDEPQYMFYENFSYLISKVEEFIQKYHLRERVAKIKAKVAARY